MILLCNLKRTEFGKAHAYRGPMCVLEIANGAENPILQALQLENCEVK
jgi:hypothetical protein